MTEQCRDCRFYTIRSDHDNEWFGYCRRYPPAFKEDRASNDGWPNVTGDSWCGEFRPKDQEAKG